MVREKFAHSFARHRLEQNNLKIFHGKKQILTPVNANFRDTDQRWNYGEFKTEITKGVSFSEDVEQKARIVRDYDELLYKTGLMISSRTPNPPKFLAQKAEYFL